MTSSNEPSENTMKTINRLISYLNSIPLNTHGLVAQWITRLTSNQKIAGSSPAKIGSFCSQVNSYLFLSIYISLPVQMNNLEMFKLLTIIRLILSPNLGGNRGKMSKL